MDYQSTVQVEAASCAGVNFTVRRMSLGARIELVQQVRSKGASLSYFQAGESAEDRLRAAEITAAIEALYIRWGLVSLQGLTIDGEPADAEAMIERGPEGLCHEIAAAVRRECFLSEEEAKN